MVAAITGVAALLHTSALAFQALKYLGVAYLLYMAWAMLKEKGALSVDVDTAPQMLELSALFMMFTLVVFAAYGVSVAAVRVHIVSRPHVMTWLRRVFAGAFVALGVRLAITSR